MYWFGCEKSVSQEVGVMNTFDVRIIEREKPIPNSSSSIYAAVLLQMLFLIVLNLGFKL